MALPKKIKLPPVFRGDTWEGVALLRRSIRAAEGATFAATAADDLLTLAGHGLTDGTRVQVGATAAGLTAAAILHVINAAADDLQVAETEGGDPVNLTADASVVLYVVSSPPVALVSARAQFRLDGPRGALVLDLDSESDPAGVVIDDADAWMVNLPEVAAGFSRAGTLYWDVETTDADGAILTPWVGTIEVADDVTRTAAE